MMMSGVQKCSTMSPLMLISPDPGLRPHQLVGPSNADLLKTDEFLRLKPGANPTKPVFTTTIREPILTNS
jgi:hypothetical protein